MQHRNAAPAASAGSVKSSVARGQSRGEPLLWHDLTLGPNDLAGQADPGSLDNCLAKASSRAGEGMVSQAVHVLGDKRERQMAVSHTSARGPA